MGEDKKVNSIGLDNTYGNGYMTEMIHRYNEKIEAEKMKVITSRIKELGLGDFDGKFSFDKFKDYHMKVDVFSGEESIYYNDGSENGKLIVRFTNSGIEQKENKFRILFSYTFGE